MKFRKGFTLIEVIISIVVMAIAAVALLKIFGTAFTGSAVPVGQVSKQYQMIQSMEAITSQYRNEITNNVSFNLSTFKASFVDGTPFVDSTKTGLITLTSSDGVYITAQPVLRVTLTDGTQTLMSIFTQ